MFYLWLALGVFGLYWLIKGATLSALRTYEQEKIDRQMKEADRRLKIALFQKIKKSESLPGFRH